MRKEFEEAIELYGNLSRSSRRRKRIPSSVRVRFQGRVRRGDSPVPQGDRPGPDFGDPYNDIGVYLIKRGDLSGAIPWLEQAKRAPRYEPRHFPYLNLGRIYLRQGQSPERCANSEPRRASRPAIRGHARCSTGFAHTLTDRGSGRGATRRLGVWAIRHLGAQSPNCQVA